MTPTELQQAIDRTEDIIYRIKQQIAEVTNPKERHRLVRQLKELQYLQL